jgi:hypothetical protein
MLTPERRPEPQGDDEAKKRAGGLTVGDTVGYSHQFLQSIGVHTGDMPHAKGKIAALVPLGREVTLAEIEWDTAEMPARVNVKNLAKVGSVAYFD